VPAVRRERAKAVASTVARIMSTPAITVRPTTPIPKAAHVMHKRRIGRVPVVDDAGRLVGIVTRGDLLAVFLRDDADLREDVTAAIGAVRIPEARRVTVDVREGIVVLAGTVPRRSHAVAAAAAARRVPGVCGLEDRTRADFDDVDIALVGP
jgi:CBS domain-containing protein